MREVAYLDRGIVWSLSYIVAHAVSRDSPPMLIFRAGIPGTYAGTYFYRYAVMNRYQLLKVDTGNYGSGLIPGNIVPWASGDVNGDSVQELVAHNGEFYPNIFYLLATLYAAPRGSRCPDSLLWYGRYDSLQGYFSEPFYITDLDQDGRKEIAFYSEARFRFYIYENNGRHSMRLAATIPCYGYRLAIGDFDQDGRMEFATKYISSRYPVFIFKCTGNDQYELWDTVSIHLSSGQDIWEGLNIDGTHNAKFFVSFFSVPRRLAWLYMCEFDQGTQSYEKCLIDSARFSTNEIYRRSICGDIDGDGIEEILWSTGEEIRVYRCTGPRQFELAWFWGQPGNNSCNLNLYDMNGNGYNEILESGSGVTHIFEVEAIHVLYPNGGEFRAGDTCIIRWETLFPPRCDSISLFLRRDTAHWRLDTIAHGLAPSETSYRWVVPDIRADACRMVAIAYGPGWQYDESDNTIRILPLGISESSQPLIRETKLLSISPNPTTGITRISYQVRDATPVNLRLADATGRIIRDEPLPVSKPGYCEHTVDLSQFSPGIYFLTFSAGAQQVTRKIVYE